jgi:DNA polymerase-3 subunit delta'
MDNQAAIIYPWLQDYWDKLLRYQQQDRLPSALLLVGDAGLGLSALIKAFTNRVVCQSAKANEAACGVCESCLLFNAGNYPDFYHVQPEEGKSSIKIDAIRELSASLSLTSQYTKPRIALIDPASAMLHQASNSLLKTLEEPSENTCLILIADKLSNIPATIRSRCQLMLVNNIDLSKAKTWLESEGCKEAEQYLNFANYSPVLALELWKKEALTARTAIFHDFIALVKGRLDPLLFVSKCLKLKELSTLKWMASWLSDAIKLKNGSGAVELLNPDLKDDLKVLEEKLHLENIHSLLDKLGLLIRLETSQVNQQLMLEEFAIQCYSLAAKQRV